MREVYHKSLILGYLKINSLRNKTVSLSDVVSKVPIDILYIDEAKLDEAKLDEAKLDEAKLIHSFSSKISSFCLFLGTCNIWKKVMYSNWSFKHQPFRSNK